MYDIPGTIKIARSMKRAIIHVSDHYMIGLSEDLSVLSTLHCESNIPRPFTAKVNDIVTEDNMEKYSNSNISVWANEYEKITDGLYINTWEEPILYNTIMDKMGKVTMWLSDPYLSIAYSVDNLQECEDFMKRVAKLKVDDGMTKYIFDNLYLATNFNKLHAINASDKVSLNIYDIDAVSYLFEYTINKKKYIIKEYIRYRKMITMQKGI